MTNNLSEVLLRFRKHKVAMVADIKCMFHQVNVSPEDEMHYASCGGKTEDWKMTRRCTE